MYDYVRCSLKSWLNSVNNTGEISALLRQIIHLVWIFAEENRMRVLFARLSRRRQYIDSNITPLKINETCCPCNSISLRRFHDDFRVYSQNSIRNIIKHFTLLRAIWMPKSLSLGYYHNLALIWPATIFPVIISNVCKQYTAEYAVTNLGIQYCGCVNSLIIAYCFYE